MGMTIPRSTGAPAPTPSHAIVVEELTRIDSSVAITVAAHHSLGTPPDLLLRHRGAEGEWLPDLASGKLSAFGLTEAGAGSDAGNTRTTAELRDGQWVINGSKMFITNAGTDITAYVTITASTGDDEISNIVVPNGTPGYEISEPMHKLLARSDTRELSFKDVTVPEGNLLSRAVMASSSSSRSSTAAASSVASMGVGLAQGAYDLAYAYAKEREQFGKPIAKFQAVQFALADMATEIEAGRALVYKAAWLRTGTPVRARGGDGEALHGTALEPGRERSAADPRGLRVHGGVADLPALPRPEDPRDRRGHERSAAHVIARLLGL